MYHFICHKTYSSLAPGIYKMVCHDTCRKSRRSLAIENAHGKNQRSKILRKKMEGKEVCKENKYLPILLTISVFQATSSVLR